jgi:pre-mRNA cleavage complex 2 protein Pcf11
METYRVVDHIVKVRMEELLATWRNSGPNGAPLFGEAAQWSIERALYGNGGPPVPVMATRSPLPQHNYGGNSPLQSGPHSQTRTIERFDRLLAIGNHDQHHNPHLYDADRMQALGKLKMVVTETRLSPEEMSQIHAQLDVLEAELEARRQVIAPVQQSIPSAALPTKGLPASLAGALANLGKLGMGSSTPPINHQAATPTQPPAPLPAASALDLIASLRSAGLLPTQGTPPAPTVVQQDLEYSNMIMSLNIKLVASDMQREIPLGSLQAINFKELPLQCRQCANRYPKTAKGQASMDQHLDWHFRQNRRAKDSAVRGQSRSWFSRLEEWIRGGHDDDVPLKRNEIDGGGVKSTMAMTPAQEAELKAATKSFVVAPSDDPGVATKPCPICKELFKSEWSEDEEEWVWKDAIKVGDVYYHGSCHYSAKTLTSSVKQMIGSREGTPQMDDRPSKAALGSLLGQVKEEEPKSEKVEELDHKVSTAAGVKRKAEEDIKTEDGEENATKILKISTAEQEQ